MAVYRNIGYRWGIANSLNNLGFVLCELEERQEARKCFQESLDSTIDMEETNLVLEALVGITTLLAKEGEEEQAVEFVAYASIIPQALTLKTEQSNSSPNWNANFLRRRLQWPKKGAERENPTIACAFVGQTGQGASDPVTNH